MALASNTKEQIAKRLKQDLEKLAPELAVSVSDTAQLTLKDSTAAVVAIAQIKQKSFNGFNIVAEISSSAGEGMPEHEAWLVVATATALPLMAKLAKAVSGVACSSMKIVVSAAPAAADMVDANATEIPNDARLGATGN